MTSKLLLVTESSCRGLRLTSRVTCQTVTMIMWRYTLDVEDAQSENTVLNIVYQTCLLMCTPLTTACILSSILTALALAMGFEALIQGFLFSLVIKLKFYFHTIMYTCYYTCGK